MGKKLLSLQYPPFYSENFGAKFFGHLGYEVLWSDIGEYDHFIKYVDLIIKRDHNMTLSDFDSVLILNFLGDFKEKFLFPKESVLSLKKRLAEISEEKGSEILFFGANMSVPSEYYAQQASLFDGMFISIATPKSIHAEIYEKLRSFALDS